MLLLERQTGISSLYTLKTTKKTLWKVITNKPTTENKTVFKPNYMNIYIKRGINIPLKSQQLSD